MLVLLVGIYAQGFQMILWSSFEIKPEIIVNCGELMPAFIPRRGELLQKLSSFAVLDMLVLSDNGS